MLNRLKLSGKMALGFGLLIMIAMIMGGLAVYSMKTVEKKSAALDEQHIPEVQLLAQLERRAQRTMYNMRGYTMSQDKSYFEAGRKDLALAKENLAQGRELCKQYPNLVILKEKVALATSKVERFEDLANQTVEKNDQLAKLRKQMDEAAKIYVENCKAFWASQNQTLLEEVKSGVGSEAVLGRYQKTVLVNDVINFGSVVREANFKAQATWNPELIKEILPTFAEIDKKLDALKAITQRDENLRQIDNIRQAASTYQTELREYMKTWLEARQADKECGGAGDEVLAIARETNYACLGSMKEISQDGRSSLNAASTVMVSGLAVALALGVLLAFFITRSITKPINVVIAGLSSGSEQVAAASNQVANASQSLAQGAGHQAASLEETSSSLEEMGSMTRQNADNAKQADSLMAEAKQVVDKADKAMAELTDSMNEISRAGEETGKIIKTIDEIAFQTNLLALNAAVEAARAGEAGAGFAVVADEVRNLAMRAAEAAKNTAELIEGTIAKTKHGSDLVARTNETFVEVSQSSTKVAELISEISAASAEQSQGIDQVNQAMSEMDKVTQQNAANAEESAAASEELSAQAETMQGFVMDLAGLVGGAKNNGQRRKPGLAAKRQAKALPAPQASKQAMNKKAREAIPLEDGDGDFRDF
ncbi:hypothetical protein AAU61_12810 [Desulfocarbo indianensis]|nr:hypothetical protein AAU61_12810 [Desulfocarbo indianensis]